MSIDAHQGEVVGSPVRRDLLLRSLRSNTNAAILGVWALVIVAIGALVLINRIGLDRPFEPGTGSAESVGATLGGWWVVSVAAGTMVLAAVLAAVACAARGERARLQAWTGTLLTPWRIVMGIWRAQLALIALALVLTFPVAAVALASGGTSWAQLGIGLAAAAIAGAATSALTIAVACRARRPAGPLAVALVIVGAGYVAPFGAHLIRDPAPGKPDPVMAIVPVVGAADAAAPFTSPAVRFGSPGGRCAECTTHDPRDAAAAPLEHLRTDVRPFTGRIPPWGWTTIGAAVVTLVSLIVARARIARSPRR